MALGPLVLAYDAIEDLSPVSHVMDVLADAMDASGITRWSVGRQLTNAARAP